MNVTVNMKVDETPAMFFLLTAVFNLAYVCSYTVKFVKTKQSRTFYLQISTLSLNIDY